MRASAWSICPHATIRMKVYDAACLAGAPATFKSTDARVAGMEGHEVHAPGRARKIAPAAASAWMSARPRTRPRPSSRRSTCARRRRCAMQERENWDFFLELPEFDRRKIKVTQLRQQQVMQPLFEFSGAAPAAARRPTSSCSRSCSATASSSPTPPAAPRSTAATCRPRRTRRTTTAAARPGTTRSSRTTPSSASASASRSTSRRSSPANCCRSSRRKLGDDLVDGILNADQTDEAGIYDQRERVAALKQKLAGDQQHRSEDAAGHRRQPGPQERLDRRRRRLGLRHRLRRPGPRAGQRPRRQRAGAGHRSLFQHRRPVLEVHAARRGGEVRRGRQAAAQEGPGPDRHDLRQHLRGQRGDGRQGRAHAQGVPRSGILSRARR